MGVSGSPMPLNRPETGRFPKCYENRAIWHWSCDAPRAVLSLRLYEQCTDPGRRGDDVAEIAAVIRRLRQGYRFRGFVMNNNRFVRGKRALCIAVALCSGSTGSAFAQEASRTRGGRGHRLAYQEFDGTHHSPSPRSLASIQQSGQPDIGEILNDNRRCCPPSRSPILRTQQTRISATSVLQGSS